MSIDPKLWTKERLTEIYNEANNITTKNPPLTTERIFAAMRLAAAHGAQQVAVSEPTSLLMPPTKAPNTKLAPAILAAQRSKK